MIEYSYYSDSRHNYLVVPCKAQTRDYQYRMIASNKIRGLLPSSIRSIDGETFLYYDITSKQSIAALFRDHNADQGDIKGVLYGLARTGEILSDYLLDNAMLMMNPEMVFYDFVQEEYCFVYYPEPTEDSSLYILASFLADRVDMEDKTAAAVILHITELSSNPTFILKKSFLDKEYEESSGKSSEAREEMKETKTADVVYDQEQKWWESEDFLSDEEEEEEDTSKRAAIKEEKKTGSRRLPGILILSVLFLIIAIALEGIRRFMVLSESLRMADAAGVVAFLALAMITALYGTFVGRKQSRIEEKEEKEAFEEEQKSRVVPTREYTAGKSEIRDGKEPCYLSEDTGDYMTGDPGPGKLYGTGEARSYRVDFSSLPCTVGNLKGFCDVLIGDTSISGLHVRFRKTEQNEIEMTDLNSTMGTFLNGRRLLPNESAIICRGDEVKIGRLEFCYR